MRTVEIRTDVPRYVLFLENPTTVYRNETEGSVKQRIDGLIKQFVTEVTPESALQPISKFPDPLRQLKDRGTKLRALGTWCKTDSFDLFVIQILYDKDDENDYLPYKHEFASRGNDHRERFENMSVSAIDKKVSEWQSRSDILVFTANDFTES